MYPSKIFHIYKENGEFIVEKIDEFRQKEVKYYDTEENLMIGLDAYYKIIDEYEIYAPKELRKRIIWHLENRGGRAAVLFLYVN